MDSRDAGRTLEVIRTLMERSCQYQFLTARAGLAAGLLAGMGSLVFLVLDGTDPWHFGAVWALVFAGSLLATCVGTVMRVRERGEKVWSRQARCFPASCREPGHWGKRVLRRLRWPLPTARLTTWRG